MQNTSKFVTKSHFDKTAKKQAKRFDKKMDELTDAILSRMDKMLENVATKDDIKRLEARLDNLETEVAHLMKLKD